MERVIRFRNRQVILTKHTTCYILRIGLNNWFTYGLDDSQCQLAIDSDAELLNLIKDFSAMYY
jgi:hypothetical protein